MSDRYCCFEYLKLNLNLYVSTFISVTQGLNVMGYSQSSSQSLGFIKDRVILQYHR